jgi:hypothetical protein
MGRQIHFHMLGEDCGRFFAAVLRLDPCVVTIRDASSPSIEPFEQPCDAVTALVLWNRKLGPSVERQYVPDSAIGSHYRFPYDVSALEFSPTEKIADWDGRPAMCAGRIYASRYQDDARHAKWFERIARWLRRHFRAHRIASSVTYVGEDAWRWHQDGGLLLPMVRPLVTSTWRDLLGVSGPISSSSGRKSVTHVPG